MDHFALVYEEWRENALILDIPQRVFPFPRAVSWAVCGGGFAIPRIIVNHSIDANEWIEDCVVYTASFLEKEGLPKESIVMLTSVSQRFQRSADRRSVANTFAVRTYATVGLGNALAAGDPVDMVSRQCGTINLIVLLAGVLSVEACLECIGVITEAKTRFLREKNVISVVSGEIATGTGTDCAVIVSLGIGNRIAYVGSHTEEGSLIACSVMDAMRKSYDLRFPQFKRV
jgi:adenosylcobinamide amidohydrolase